MARHPQAITGWPPRASARGSERSSLAECLHSLRRPRRRAARRMTLQRSYASGPGQAMSDRSPGPMPGAAIVLLPGVTRHRAEPQPESDLRHLCPRPRLQERSTGMASRSRPFASLRVRPHWEGVVGRTPSRMAVSTVGDETRGQGIGPGLCRTGTRSTFRKVQATSNRLQGIGVAVRQPRTMSGAYLVIARGEGQRPNPGDVRRLAPARSAWKQATPGDVSRSEPDRERGNEG